MGKYKITVELQNDEIREGRSYPDTTTVYTQIIEDLSVSDLAVFLNQTNYIPSMIFGSTKEPSNE